MSGQVQLQKQKILRALEKAYSEPCDLSVNEVAQAAGMSRITASKYLSVLEAEGKIEVSRRIGKAVFFRIKKK